MEFINKDKARDSIDELEARVNKYGKYEHLEMKDLTSNTEILFIDEHMCNSNLIHKKKVLMDPEQVIKANQKNLVTLSECALKFDEDADVKQ